MENNEAFAAPNPLTKLFRQPAIYIKLPSAGKFWPDGALDMPVTGEIPIYPLTTRDEIALRTPDALMNGAGVVSAIQSCCPNIKDAWKTPNVDVDALLIAIRIASYGNQMDFNTKCPHCGEENTHSLDLQVALASIVSPDYSKKVPFDGFLLKLKPQAYFGANKVNQIEFEEQKLMQALQKPDLDPVLRAKEIADSMTRLVEISFDTISNSTEYIELEDGTIVTNHDHIREFYKNARGSIVKEIQTKIAETNISGGTKPQLVKCSSCEKEYSVPITFDYSSFFG